MHVEDEDFVCEMHLIPLSPLHCINSVCGVCHHKRNKILPSFFSCFHQEREKSLCQDFIAGA